MTMKIGSLCTGYGGLDLAVEREIGGQVAWYSEIDKHPSTLLEQRFPGVPNLGDLKMMNWEELVSRKPDWEKTQQMYDLYCQGLSLAEVASHFGVSRQTVYTRFKRAHRPMRERKPALPFVEYDGCRYTLGVNGYMRRTDGNRQLLHRAIWEREVGPIPEGWEIHHRDHDKTNNTLSNFECLSKEDHARLHAAGCSQFRHECEGGDAIDSFSVDILTGGYP